MDFVDLDKVLDEFEEEEKAADSLTPGQEVRPSGYSDFVESRRDKPWESVSEIPVPGIGVHLGYGITGKGTVGGMMYDYDIPYDAGGKSNTEYIESSHLANLKKNITTIEYGKGDLNLGNSLDNSVNSSLDSLQNQKQNSAERELDSTSHNNDYCTEPEAGLTLSTSGQAEKEHLNNAVEGSNHGSNDFLFSRHNGLSHEDYRSVEKGLKASQVTAVQTDALTPRTEKELSSVPFPKSDIIVDGHENSESHLTNSFRQNSHSVAPEQPDVSCNADNSHMPYATPEAVQNQLSQPDLQSVSIPEKQSVVTDVNQRSDSGQQDLATSNGQSFNGFDQGHGHGHLKSEVVAAVGFDSITDEINEDEIDKYLNDSDISTDLPTGNIHQNQSVDMNKGQNHVLPEKVMPNPDIVLDVGRSENLKSQTGNDVQYSQPSFPIDTRQHKPSSIDSSTEVQPNLVSAQEPQIENTMRFEHLPDASASSVTSNTGFAMQVGRIEIPQQEAKEASSATEQDVSNNKQTSSEESSLSDTARESSSGPSSESGSSPSDQGSPQMLGVGARPKDPVAVKKNRPNSLLGLSKLSMDPPYNIVHEVVENTAAVSTSVDNVSQPEVVNQDTDTSQSSGQDGGETVTENLIQTTIEGSLSAPHAPSVDHKHLTNLEIRQQIEQEQRQRMNVSAGGQHANLLGGLPDVQSDMPQVEQAPGVGRFGMGSGGIGETVDDMPVMRRGEEQFNQPGLDPQSGVPPRPHSWSPGSGQIAPPGKLKRPTSLNLPPRGEFGLAGDRSPDTGGRMRGIGKMRTDNIPEESDQSVVEEYSEGDDNMMDGADGGQEDLNFPQSNDPPPQSIIHSNLGRVAPTWVPDNEAPNCMQCQARFTFTKRRHHCRACGKVFCSTCCNQKTPLPYMDMKEARVCLQCHQLLQSADWLSSGSRSPNPNNPSEYCSTIPPQQQANARAPLPTVLVPVGVLKREGSQRRTEPKQVMFSDGIRPGGDLTELDGSNETRLPPRRIGRMQKKVEKTPGGGQTSPKTRRLRATENSRNKCLIPDEGLPPLYSLSEKGDVTLEENYNPEIHLTQAKNEEAEPVIFAINSNLQVLVKVLMLDCCVNRECWSFTTRGMCTVGQEEIVIILECFPEEKQPPRDIFCHLATVYEEAGKGNTVTDMGHSIFNQSFLDSRDHGGFLYLRATFQCMQKLLLPSPPYLFGILLQKWETPWAKVFPLRLLLRLGAEYRYYPCPLVSIRNRKPVFFEIGHTIMNLLADFRNYQYMLPQIRGVHIHMEDKKTVINFPRNRYDELMKMVNSSNEHVMALGSNFSPDADSHLVCIQNDEGNYQTQAINIQNKPRKVTGASFVVFNGALKTTSGLRAKSSIVEDGLMVQILPECMVAVKQSIKDMTDFTIGCGSVAVDKPEEVVVLQWVDDDKNVNIGVKSPIDSMSLDGVDSIHIHNSTDYVGERRAIRWTEVFFIQNEDSGARWEPVDLSRLAETLASATCIALSQHLDRLKEAQMTKIGLRVTIDTEQVGYEIGSNNEKLADFYMNDLDSGLIPVIHRAASQNQDGPIVLELLFFILE